MFHTPSLWPRRRIAKRLPSFQWDIIRLMRGEAAAPDLLTCVWSFMSEALGHPNECMFDSELVTMVDAISIPGGEDESNRFLVRVIGGTRHTFDRQISQALDECARHRAVWLIWTNGPLWSVARVPTDASEPQAFLSLDIMRPVDRALIDQLYLFCLEGMTGGALEKAWRHRGGGSANRVSTLEDASQRFSTTDRPQRAPFA